MSKHILFVSSWYPTQDKKSHGIFFKRHAEAAALLNQISSIHICSGSKQSIEVKRDQGVLTIIATYKKVTHRLPILSTLQKLWRSLQCFKYSYQTLLEQESAPDLVLLNIIFPAGVYVLWLHYIKKLPFIIQEQWSGYYPEDGNYKGVFTKLITAKCASLAKAILVVSDKLEQNMQRHGLHNNYIRIGNVVDTDLFVPISKQPPPPFRMVHVSTINDKEKNITGIIDAAHILKQKQVDFIIDIVGDGPERNHFEELSKKYQLLHTHIIFHGFKTPQDVARIVGGAHCFVLNSNYEGLPCVLPEAMSCGIPVISTGVGAVPEIVGHKQGIVIPPGDVQALADAMQNMISNHEQYVCDDIRAYVNERYSYPAISRVFDEIFSKVLSK